MFKDHPWKDSYMVFVYRGCLITRSFMQQMSNLELKSMVAIHRELLNKELVFSTGLTVFPPYNKSALDDFEKTRHGILGNYFLYEIIIIKLSCAS